MERPKRYALAIELTSHCNQTCGYCYNGWREDNGKGVGALPTQDLLQLVDRALSEVDFDHVTLTGGEPFARKDVFDVLDVVKGRGKRAKIISNGGLITDAIAARLAPYRPYFVQVTLNATTKELHEELVGEGWWDATLEGIRTLRRHGVRLSGCTVVTRKNARLVGSILDLWRSLGVKDIALSRFSPAGYASTHVAELLPSRSEVIDALTQAELRGRDHGMSISSTMPIPQCVIEHSEFPHIRFGGCPIGTEMQEVALGPRGELRNCTLHSDAIGDARTTSFAELLTAPAVTAYRDVVPEFCAPCPLKKSCLGGCGGAAHSVLGDPRGLDPFVAQHVDEAFAARLRSMRAGLVPASALVR